MSSARAPTHYWLLLLLLLLSAALCYAPGLDGPFLFDDGPALTGNPFLRIDGRELDDWRTASLSSNSGPLRRPLAMLSFTANQVAAGAITAMPVKLVNVLLHLGCGVLVFLLARAVVARARPDDSQQLVGHTALLAAALWLLAPLQVSTVL